MTSAIASTWAQSRRTSRKSLISSADIVSPAQRRRLVARLILLDPGDAAIGKEQHAIRHLLDARIMGNDHCRGAELAVDAKQRLDHPDTRFRVQRTRRLVAEQHRGTLGDRSRDRDPLLLTAGKL